VTSHHDSLCLLVEESAQSVRKLNNGDKSLSSYPGHEVKYGSIKREDDIGVSIVLQMR
jgi:hypothetical protein